MRSFADAYRVELDVCMIDGTACDVTNTTGCDKAPATISIGSDPFFGDANPFAIAIDQRPDPRHRPGWIVLLVLDGPDRGSKTGRRHRAGGVTFGLAPRTRESVRP
jgi:hypothetical protein